MGITLSFFKHSTFKGERSYFLVIYTNVNNYKMQRVFSDKSIGSNNGVFHLIKYFVRYII